MVALVGCGSSGSSDPAATEDSAGERAAATPLSTSAAAAPSAEASTATTAPASTPEPSSPAPSASSPAPGASGATTAKPRTAASAAPAAPAPTSERPTASATPTPAPGDPPRGPVAGKPWQLVATAVADPGYQCNSEYPNKFTTTGGTNVTYPDPKPRGACAGNRVSVTIPIVPTAAGPGTVVGTLRYGICDDAKTNCLVRTKAVTLPFTAAP